MADPIILSSGHLFYPNEVTFVTNVQWTGEPGDLGIPDFEQYSFAIGGKGWKINIHSTTVSEANQLYEETVRALNGRKVEHGLKRQLGFYDSNP